MSEQTNNEQSNDLKNQIKTEIKAELNAESAQKSASVPLKKSFTRILYPVITFIVGLGIGLSTSQFGGVGHHGNKYEHHHEQGSHYNGSVHRN
ncbi:hypothetical protein NDK43_07250 [Neobacillus pocheonensis]|uniref:Uncharacterized protein n=1 Tax=Neobacillus pocheonensis TaxID=363869 RepID=A0ABT0W7D7_9BACI|nr:hypothetical protein [Neobacillus pocheonensis]